MFTHFLIYLGRLFPAFFFLTADIKLLIVHNLWHIITIVLSMTFKLFFSVFFLFLNSSFPYAFPLSPLDTHIKVLTIAFRYECIYIHYILLTWAYSCSLWNLFYWNVNYIKASIKSWWNYHKVTQSCNYYTTQEIEHYQQSRWPLILSSNLYLIFFCPKHHYPDF